MVGLFELWVHLRAQLGLHDVGAHWPWLLQLTLGLLWTELVYYAFHRLAHQHPFFWRFHSVHHGVERVCRLNAGRFHPSE